MGLIDWVKGWTGRGVGITVDIPWTGAEFDKCLICGVQRRYHDKKDHHFKEKNNELSD